MIVIGRSNEMAILKNAYERSISNLIVVYGRRRIGKSFLLSEFSRGYKSISIEGLEGGGTPLQLAHFQKELYRQTHEVLLKNAPFSDWTEIFEFLTAYIQKQNKKIILVLDEFQWMACKKSDLVSLLKNYWDQHWKPSQKIMLVLCGSIASFMLNDVIHSKALYGRIDLELQIKELSPGETHQILGPKMKEQDFFKLFLILGGIPKYFEMVDPGSSLAKNLEQLFFRPSGFFFNEIDKVFYSQFKEARIYEKIVREIQLGIKSADELSRALKIPSGGRFLRYLDILEKARFVKGYRLFGREASRIKKYKLFDEYLRFYFKFVSPFRKVITDGMRTNLFKMEVQSKWEPWLGFAFEHFCLKYNHLISKALGIENSVLDFGPLFQRDQNRFQVDLMFKTDEKEIFVCECKYSSTQVTGDVIAEMYKRIEQLKVPADFTLRKVLIAPWGVSSAVTNSRYFDKILTASDLFY